MSTSCSRRDFLKYLTATAGAASLFSLDTLLSLSRVQAADEPLQKFVFVNFSDGYPNGYWAPGQNGDGTLTMNLCNQALQPIQENCVFINGMDLRGSSGHEGFATQWRDATRDAPSIDRLIASQDAFRVGYTMPHVRAGVDTGHWGHGSRVPSQGIGSNTLVYNDSPSSLYENLFGSGPVAGNLEARKKQLLLEYSTEDLQAMMDKYGTAQSSKLEAHMLELNTALENIVNSNDYSLGDPESYLWKTLSSAGGRDARAELQVQNVVLSLATGRSRVGCLALGSTNDNVGIGGVADGKSPHDTSHKLFGVQAFADTRNWYMTQVERIAYRLGQIPDVNGTSLFDNTLIVVTSEMSDDHSPSNIPVILIGGRSPAGTNNGLVKFGPTGAGRSVSKDGAIGSLWSGLAEAVGIISPYQSTPVSDVFV